MKLFLFLIFGLGLLYTIIGVILTLTDKKRECHRQAQAMEEVTDCALSEEEADDLAACEIRYHVTHGQEIVVWQQLRQVVRAGLSPEFVMEEEKK